MCSGERQGAICDYKLRLAQSRSQPDCWSAPLGDRLVGPRAGAGVELAGPADLLLGVDDHLTPLGDPPDRAREREDGGEHLGRDVHRLENDA